MSTFTGFLREYPSIVIDNFVESTLGASAFFLSHCHSDHMEGLNSESFSNKLKECANNKLYCSEVTESLLLSNYRFTHLQPHLESLPIEEPITISIPETNYEQETEMLVTLIPAGHCPGSVMFLFEGSNGTVLYTGDFRLLLGQTAKIKSLHINNRVKAIDSIYLDTTFCVPEAMYLPTREQSLEATINTVQDWISKGPDHFVHIDTGAEYGYEFVFIELAKKFNCKVHVIRSKIKKYRKLQSVLDSVTTDPDATKIHACHPGCVNAKKEEKVLTIKLSVMFFTKYITLKDIVFEVPNENRCRICFSTHSSYSEILELVRYLKPKHIYPNVVPMNSSIEQVLQRLKETSDDNPSVVSQKNVLNGKRIHSTAIANTESDLDLDFDDSDHSVASAKRPNRATPEWRLNLSPSSTNDETPVNSQGSQTSSYNNSEGELKLAMDNNSSEEMLSQKQDDTIDTVVETIVNGRNHDSQLNGEVEMETCKCSLEPSESKSEDEPEKYTIKNIDVVDISSDSSCDSIEVIAQKLVEKSETKTKKDILFIDLSDDSNQESLEIKKNEQKNIDTKTPFGHLIQEVIVPDENSSDFEITPEKLEVETSERTKCIVRFRSFDKTS